MKANEYRYTFNGKETDGETGIQDYGMRIYNAALGKFLSVDPLVSSFPGLTPYQFANNTPVQAIDLDGLEEVNFTKSISQNRNLYYMMTANSVLKKLFITNVEGHPGYEKTLVFYTVLTGRTPGVMGETYFQITTDYQYILWYENDAETHQKTESKTSEYEKAKERVSHYPEIQGTLVSGFASAGYTIRLVALNATLVEKASSSESALIDILTAAAHEVNAHLLPHLNGDYKNSDEYLDHLNYFNLSADKNSRIYNKYKSVLAQGYSIPFDELPKDSAAYKDRDAIKKAISDEKKKGTIKFGD